MKHGSRPFIGATDSNNGITAWVENTNESLDSAVLGVNYNGSVVETFYHPYECIFSDDVKRLHLKSDVTASAYLMLFLKNYDNTAENQICVWLQVQRETNADAKDSFTD